MNRRMFLKVSAAVPAAVAAAQFPGLASVARAQQKDFTPRPGTWRTFEITTRVEVLQPSGVARVWLPAPSVVSDYQQSIENNWAGNAKVMRIATEPKYGAWCEPCREEMPSMQRLKERFAGQPFAVLAVNYGEADTRASEFLKRSSLDLTVLLDPSQDASRAWRVRVLPASFLVGPDGRARYAVIGEIDWMSPAAVETVRRLLPVRP